MPRRIWNQVPLVPKPLSKKRYFHRYHKTKVPVTSLNLPEFRPAKLIANPEYDHHYGGVARDVYLTREQFARFFDVSVEFVDSLPVNVKVFDDMQPDGEMLGYIIQHHRPRRGQITRRSYRVTIIHYEPREFHYERDQAYPQGLDRHLFKAAEGFSQLSDSMKKLSNAAVEVTNSFGAFPDK